MFTLHHTAVMNGSPFGPGFPREPQKPIERRSAQRRKTVPVQLNIHGLFAMPPHLQSRGIIYHGYGPHNHSRLVCQLPNHQTAARSTIYTGGELRDSQ